MRTVTTHAGSGHVEVVDRPAGPLPAGHVRVRVSAATINPVDLGVVRGVFGAAVPDDRPLGLGWDVAGELLETAGDVGGLQPGDRVVGMSDWFTSYAGTQGDEVVLPERSLARAPVGVEDALAATVPLNALTAAQALGLLDAADDATVAVTGAAGAVGGYAVELAVRRGLRVLAVARESDREWLSDRGAEVVVAVEDVGASLRSAVPDGVDGLLDAAALGAPALRGVRDGGVHVGVLPDLPAAERGVRVLLQQVASDPQLLAELVALVERGQLTPRVSETFPLDHAADAYAAAAVAGRRGKVVLVP